MKLKKMEQWKIPRYLQQTMRLLPKRRRRQFLVLLLAMVAVALLETISLGVLSIFATTISSPKEVIDSNALRKFSEFIGWNAEITIEQLILYLSIAVVLATAFKNTAKGVVQYWVSRFGAVVQGHVGSVILSKFFEVDYEWHLKENPHNLFIILGWRLHVGIFTSSSLTAVSNFILVVIMMGSIVAIQPLLMPMMIVILGLASYYIYKAVRRRIDRNAKNVQKHHVLADLEGAKTIHGMKDVRIFGLEDKFLRDYSNQVFTLSRYLAFQGVLGMIPAWVMETVGFFFLALSIIVMFFFMNLSKVEIFGTLSLLAVAAWRVLPAINKIISSLTSLRSVFPYIDKIFRIIDDIDNNISKRNRNNNENSCYKRDNNHRIYFTEKFRFDNVSFRYATSESYALKNISCTIQLGASVGIVGHSGAGKSTFVDLFIGLLKPTDGTISIDGNILNDNAFKTWRRNIGYVPQFPYIYDCSLAENIAFGNRAEELDEERILEACKKASIDFLDDLDNGIHSRIGERGLMISGGQRQRVAIARALYNEPSVLVFDEATSALDTKSERSIQYTIDSFKGEQTVVIIAHRLTTVENCDYLIWLEKGRLVDIGKPSDIIPRYSEHLVQDFNEN